LCCCCSDISTLQASLAELREQHQELLRHHHVMTTESEQRLKELIEKDVILVQTTRELQQNREKVEIVTAILQKQKSEICSLQVLIYWFILFVYLSLFNVCVD
jgi:coenzyme F420-reducing hydrogenase gamma subunit